VAVAVPSDPSSGPALNGQILQLSVSIKTTVKDLKERVSEQLGNMAVNKFQLKASSGFLKDAQTLAAVNIGAGGTLELSLRSRGGKR